MILVAPTAFKGTIPAGEAAAALAAGARVACPGAEVRELPVSDGGPGLIDALRAARGGELRFARVRDPLGRPVDARILLLELEGGPAAVLESADACGIHLLARAELDPLRLGTGGVGELIAAASGLADTVVAGLGGSATVDGGAGMASALGWRFLDDAGRQLPAGGAALARLVRLEPPPGRAASEVIALADVRNPLLGALGAAAVFAPQKGARPDQVPLLERGLARLADVVARDGGPELRALPGAGAAGGLGAACVAFLDATLERGAEWVLRAVDFDALLARARLVITGEGSYDAQSSMGKVTGEIVARAGRAGVPVLLVAGRVRTSIPPHVTVAPPALDVLDAAALRSMAAAGTKPIA